MKSILIATRNPGKLSEWKTGLQPLRRQIISLRDISIERDYEEVGETFEQNAVGKANYYGSLTGLDTIGDDGGIVITALGNEPGVHTRRWKGYDMTDEELIDYTLERLRDVPLSQRQATLITVAAYVPHDPDREPIIMRSELNGSIAEQPFTRVTPGYPFRALFIVKEYNTYYEALTADQHAQVNQRRQVIDDLVQRLIPA